MKTITERLQYLYLKFDTNPSVIESRNKILHPNSKFTKQNLYNIASGLTKSLSLANAEIICEIFPNLNIKWLTTGKGEMLNTASKTDELTTEHNIIGIGTPYYDIDFTSSFLEVENSQQTEPTSYISHPFFKGCDFVVRNSGQSMAKVICHGDAIGLVKIENWKEFFPFGEIYAIITSNNFRMIKVITKGDSEGSYTLISKPTDSKKDEFPPQQIKITDITSIFRVQASSHLF